MLNAAHHRGTVILPTCPIEEFNMAERFPRDRHPEFISFEALNSRLDARLISPNLGALLVPTKGCLFPGYLVAFFLGLDYSRYSLASLSDKQFRKSVDLIKTYVAVMRQIHSNVILAEHGSSPIAELMPLNACTQIFHMHFLPLSIEAGYRILEMYHAKGGKEDLYTTRWSRVRKFCGNNPYQLFSPDSGKSFYVWINDTSLMSFARQWIRRCVAEIVGKPNQHPWQGYEFPENIAATFNMFRNDCMNLFGRSEIKMAHPSVPYWILNNPWDRENLLLDDETLARLEEWRLKKVHFTGLVFTSQDIKDLGLPADFPKLISVRHPDVNLPRKARQALCIYLATHYGNRVRRPSFVTD